MPPPEPRAEPRPHEILLLRKTMISAADCPAAIFIPNPEKKSGYEAIRHDHPAHPSLHRFADEVSGRNYLRELQAPTMAIPILIAAAANLAASVALVRAVIALRHGARSPLMHAPATARSLTEIIFEADHQGLPFVWIVTDHVTAKAAAIQAAHGNMRLYFTTPPAPRVTREIAMRSRLITLHP